MSTLSELLQNYVNKPYDELLALASDSLVKLSDFFSSIDEEASGNVLLHIIATTLAADGKFTKLEYQFICDLLNLDVSYEDMKELLAEFNNGESLLLTDKVFDNIQSTEVKAEMLNLMLCIMAVDENISREEVRFVLLLLE